MNITASENVIDFDPTEKRKSGLERTISIWLTDESKKKYDLIQKSSGRRFTDHLRNLILNEINKAATKIKY